MHLGRLRRRRCAVLSGRDRGDPGDPSRRPARAGQRAQPHQPDRGAEPHRTGARRTRRRRARISSGASPSTLRASRSAPVRHCDVEPAAPRALGPLARSPMRATGCATSARSGGSGYRSWAPDWRTSSPSRRSRCSSRCSIRNVLHQGPLALGLVLATGGVGGGVTAMLVARFGAPRLRITWMWAGWAVSRRRDRRCWRSPPTHGSPARPCPSSSPG